MKQVFKYLVAFLLVFTILDSTAQIRRKAIKRNNKKMGAFKGIAHKFPKVNKYNFLEFGISSMNYFGDIAPSSSFAATDISSTRPSFSILFGHRFGPRYTVRAGLSWGTLRGNDFNADESDNDDVYRYVRNLSFRNRIAAFSVTAMFDLYENQSTYLNRVPWTPYVFAGAAIIHHNPQAQVPEVDVHNNNQPFENAGDWVNLKEYGTEGQNTSSPQGNTYGNIQFSIPFGIGVRVKLNTALDFSFEIGARYLFFDYIDDVSGGYVDLGLFSDPLARALSDRSQEQNAINGDPRDLVRINEVTSPNTYVGADGNTYTVFNGFGSEDQLNIRGNKNNNDFYTVTSFKIAYILNGSFRKPKFR